MEDLEPNPATGLQRKIVDNFEGKVVRKDLTHINSRILCNWRSARSSI